MENKSTFHEFQLIMELFRSKHNELQDIINNLKINDVKEDKTFIRTKERIKNQILLQPVRFQEPRVSDHRSELRKMVPNYIDPFGGQRQVTIAEVEFPFEGSEELFGYRPDSVSYSDPTVYLPIGGSVKVEIIIERLDKEAVLLQANREMSLTKNLINDINSQTENWSKSMDRQIDDMLDAKRKELIKFYQ